MVYRGPGATGLLKYLLGPDAENTHVDPHVIAGFEGYPEPAIVDGWPDHRRLGALLDSTWRSAQMTTEDRPVYHVSVGVARADPDQGLPADPHLTDEQFREICEELVHRAGLDACRWVAVRHDRPGESHAHIVATLASEDGRRQWPVRGDFFKLHAVCREYEKKFDLRQVADPPGENGGVKRPTRAEQEKSTRKQWSQPTRTLLREQVRAVAGRAESVEDFMRRLRDEGLLAEWRLSPKTGLPTGYKVGVDRPARDGSVERIWFGGGKLASDLTLPKLRARWDRDDAHHDVFPSQPDPALMVDRGLVWRQAVDAARAAAAAVSAHVSDPRAASDAAWAASDFMASAARVVKGRQGRVLREAAAGFERAGFESWGRVAPPSQAGGGLRQAARLLTLSRFVPDEDQKRLLLLLAQLAALADAIARMREEQDRAAQAAAAARAAMVLQAAAERRPDADEQLSPAKARDRSREYARLREMVL